MPQAPPRSELLHGGFTAVPNIVLLRTDIGGMAKTLYALILDIVQFQKRQPTVEDLAALLGGSERVVRRATAELVDANLLEVHRRGLGMPNAYTLLEPPPLILQNVVSGGDETSDPFLIETEVQDTLSLTRERRAVQKLQSAPRRDEVWEALVEIFGAAPAGSERGRWNVACKSLKQSGATPSLIRRAAATYRTHPSYAQCIMTPTALAANWTILTATPKTAHELEAERQRARIADIDARRQAG